ncbi:MAG: ABC transporter permease [Candidatus Zixiibacteriota bacterium]
MRAIWHIALKDLRLLVRDHAGFFWLLAFPLIMALFFGFVFGGFGSGGGKGKMKVVFVDNTDGAQYAGDFRTLLDSSAALNLEVSTLDSAREKVLRGKSQAYVALKKSDSSDGPAFGFYPGGVPEIEVGIDPSRQAEAAYLQGTLIAAHFELIIGQIQNPAKSRELLQSGLASLDSADGLLPAQRTALSGLLNSFTDFLDQAQADGASGENPMAGAGPFSPPEISVSKVIARREGPRSSFEITFPQSLMWGLIGCVTAFALSIVTERTRGTLVRLRLAPLSKAHLISGKGLACFVASLAICAILMGIGITVFGVRMDDPAKLALAILACALCFVGIMMFISVLGRTEQSVSGAGWAIMLVMSMTGGGMVPLIVMPDWMITLGSVSPVKWGIVALEGAIWRGFSYTELATPVTILAGIGAVAFVSGVTILSRRGLSGA